MSICPHVLAQTTPKGVSAYHRKGPDAYKAFAMRVMDWCDAQPEPVRRLIHEFGFRRVYALRGLSPIQMAARLRGIPLANARAAERSRERYGNLFDSIQI